MSKKPVHFIDPILCPRPGRRHLFVYDLFLDESRFRQACPEAEFVTTARCLNRRWIVNSDGRPAIAHSHGYVVHGVVWQMSAVAQCGLEGEMGFPVLTTLDSALAKGRGGETLATDFFNALNVKNGFAAQDDLIQLSALARKWEFPESYIDEISGWRL